jgi:hypothetical protein
MTVAERFAGFLSSGVAPTSQNPAQGAPLCEVCGEPLGVYEPLVEVRGERIRRTSRAAAPDLLCGHGASCYHARCFDQRANADQ